MDDGPGRDGATLPMSRQCRTVWKQNDRSTKQRRVGHFKIITTPVVVYFTFLSTDNGPILDSGYTFYMDALIEKKY